MFNCHSPNGRPCSVETMNSYFQKPESLKLMHHWGNILRKLLLCFERSWTVISQNSGLVMTSWLDCQRKNNLKERESELESEKENERKVTRLNNGKERDISIQNIKTSFEYKEVIWALLHCTAAACCAYIFRAMWISSKYNSSVTVRRCLQMYCSTAPHMGFIFFEQRCRPKSAKSFSFNRRSHQLLDWQRLKSVGNRNYWIAQKNKVAMDIAASWINISEYGWRKT